MNRLLPFALALVAATMCFTACGDDSGSGASDEISVNSSDDEGLDAASSSGKTSKKSSSSKGSSAKSSGGASSADVTLSSSQGRLSSSSVAAGTDRGSSSSGAASSSSSKIPCSSEGSIIHSLKDGVDITRICENGFWEPFVRSSSSAGSSSSYYNMDSLFSSKVSYGEFTDPRDGQTYRTLNIQFGYDDVDSIEAFAQNLNYGKQVKLGTLDFDDNVVEKFCYNDDPWYCDNGFGGLYSWSETLGLPKACDSVRVGSTESCPKVTGVVSTCSLVQGSCPDGWHVMNEREWTIMRGGIYETGSFLVSKVTGGNNLNGFSALLGGGGYYDADTLSYLFIKDAGYFWLPHEANDVASHYKGVHLNRFDDSDYRFRKNYGLSVRCVKDYPSSCH